MSKFGIEVGVPLVTPVLDVVFSALRKPHGTYNKYSITGLVNEKEVLDADTGATVTDYVVELNKMLKGKSRIAFDMDRDTGKQTDLFRFSFSSGKPIPVLDESGALIEGDEIPFLGAGTKAVIQYKLYEHKEWGILKTILAVKLVKVVTPEMGAKAAAFDPKLFDANVAKLKVDLTDLE